jgi:catechol 2,3-dioxygenase-like lactoylglutathione lyase family enzyme
MDIELVTSVALITPDPARSRELYVETIGLQFTSESGEYLHSESMAGVNHLGLWPLAQAAQACFGADRWPEDLPTPQVSIEFEVADARAVGEAAAELVDAGYELLHDAREEPWGQTVARILSPEGAIVGISYAPSMHAPRA